MISDNNNSNNDNADNADFKFFYSFFSPYNDDKIIIVNYDNDYDLGNHNC